MRSTVHLNDILAERAKSLTGTKETAALVRQALETLVRVELRKLLIALGGSMPEAEAAPRRRSDLAKSSFGRQHSREHVTFHAKA